MTYNPLDELRKFHNLEEEIMPLRKEDEFRELGIFIEKSKEEIVKKDRDIAKQKLLDKLERQRPKLPNPPVYLTESPNKIENKAYVYFCVHEETGGFYFGYRKANSKPPSF